MIEHTLFHRQLKIALNLYKYNYESDSCRNLRVFEAQFLNSFVNCLWAFLKCW